MHCELTLQYYLKTFWKRAAWACQREVRYQGTLSYLKHVSRVALPHVSQRGNGPTFTPIDAHTILPQRGVRVNLKTTRQQHLTFKNWRWKPTVGNHYLLLIPIVLTFSIGYFPYIFHLYDRFHSLCHLPPARYR